MAPKEAFVNKSFETSEESIRSQILYLFFASVWTIKPRHTKIRDCQRLSGESASDEHLIDSALKHDNLSWN
jgi:hypothetical protein